MKILIVQTAFKYTDDEFVDEFVDEAPFGALPRDAARRLRNGEEILVESGLQKTKIKIYDPEFKKYREN